MRTLTQIESAVAGMESAPPGELVLRKKQAVIYRGRGRILSASTDALLNSRLFFRPWGAYGLQEHWGYVFAVGKDISRASKEGAKAVVVPRVKTGGESGVYLKISSTHTDLIKITSRPRLTWLEAEVEFEMRDGELFLVSIDLGKEKRVKTRDGCGCH